MEVHDDSVTVTGTYWFRVNDQHSGRLPIMYPFPVDEQHAVFDGSGLSSGIYITRLVAGGTVQTGKMLMVK